MPGFRINGEGYGIAGDGPFGKIEVARSHRYIISISSAKSDVQPINDIRFYAHSCDRPNIEFDRIKIDHGINEIYIPGKVRWAPVEIKFYEVLDLDGEPNHDSTAAALLRWRDTILYEKGQHIRDKNSDDIKSDVIIEMLNGGGATVWTYTLRGAWPIKITSSSLSYKSSDLAEISVQLHYDWVDQKQGEGESPGVSAPLVEGQPLFPAG